MPDLCFYAPWIMKEPISDDVGKSREKTDQL